MAGRRVAFSQEASAWIRPLPHALAFLPSSQVRVDTPRPEMQERPRGQAPFPVPPARHPAHGEPEPGAALALGLPLLLAWLGPVMGKVGTGQGRWGFNMKSYVPATLRGQELRAGHRCPGRRSRQSQSWRVRISVSFLEGWSWSRRIPELGEL